MRIVYLIKKGLHCYPPCLNQVLMLDDLGVKLVVYHGKNSSAVNSLLDNRKIEHYEFSSDIDSKNRMDSAINFVKFCLELRKKFKFDYGDTIWFGNAETVLAVDRNALKNYKYVLSVLELYDEGTIYDKKLKKVLGDAAATICCEKHRAAIMQSRYKLSSVPYVLSNKPYNDLGEPEIKEQYLNIINKHEGSFIVVYQGVIAKDRPLNKIAEALHIINDNNIAFFVLGKCSDEYKKYIQGIYSRTEFLGYVPAPEHLAITAKCNLGIANYDTRNLNNVFCAPNKIYEYARYGIPMLCSLNVGLTETVGAYGAGICVDFNDHKELVRAIKDIQSHYDEFSNSALRLYNETENFSIMQEIYEKISE